MESKFKDYKFRCSSLGHILTSPELTAGDKLSDKQKEELKALQDRQKEAVKNPKRKLTASMETKMADLITKRDAPDRLPSGVITHLDDIFRSVFWKRRRLLYNKYLDKGNIAEEDSLGLISLIDGVFYIKNTEQLSNDYIQGCPDNRQGKIRDTKSNWDLDTFDKADLSKIYEYQIKGYMWLDKKTEGELDYCLVNTPYHQLINEKTSLWYKMGNPDDDDERFIEALAQIERNMIFDVELFRKNYPNYDFYNTDLNFSIPPICRVKRFKVELLPEDIKHIKKRVVMCREYLVNKEAEVIKNINDWFKLEEK